MTDDEILDEARKRYQACVDMFGDNREAALDDLRMLSGDHWPDEARRQRELEGRPCLTVNSLPTYLHQVTNDQRQNKPSIRVHPVDDDADIETAEVFQGLIRHIEYDSNADVCYDTSVNSAAAVGFGYFRWVTEYEDETSFDQIIKFKRVRNPLSVKIDPMSTEPDGSDMQYCFIESRMTRDEFKRQYPDAQASNWPLGIGVNYPQWMDNDTVLLCEYYAIEKTNTTICLLSDGTSGYADELPKVLPLGVTKVKERKGTRTKVMWRKITGMDVLDKKEVLCKWIPVFPVYGDEIDIEGKVIRSGLIRNAKDPSMMYDYWMTSATEEIALRPKTPFIGAVGQFETAKTDWSQANNRSFSYLEYDPITVDGIQVGAPQRQPPADVPTGMLAMAMHASDNIKKTTGLFDASLGAKGTATSGIQEREQQHQGDVVNFHYTDNLQRTIRHCGRTLVYSIPKYYDTERTVRILGEDDSADYATVNKLNLEGEKAQDGTIKAVLNNLGAGTYDVTVSSGPAYSTLRQEAVAGMASNMEKNPALWQIFGDLFVKNQDWPGAEEMADRIKRTIPPQILGPDEDEQGGEMIQTPHGPLPLAKAGEAINGMEMHIQQLEQAMQAQQAEAQKVAAEKAAVDAAKVSLDAQQKVMKAEFDRQMAELARVKAELSAEVATQDVQEGKVIADIESRVKDFELMQERARVAQMEAAQIEAPEAPEQSDNNPQMMAMMEVIAQTMQKMESVIEVIAAPKQPKQISIKAPSGAVYNGTVQ